MLTSAYTSSNQDIMRIIFLLLVPLALVAQAELEPQSMLHQADWISKKFALEVAKAPPPLLSPQPQSCLNTASVWFSIDLSEMPEPAFEHLNQEELWIHLKELGVEAVHFKGLKQGGAFRTGLGLDPKWGASWESIANILQNKGIALIGDSLGSSTGLSADFWLALKNYRDYPSLYHLIEIEKWDWKLLPTLSGSQFAVNIPWLTLQKLHKKGYVPEQFAPYVKTSQWNATPQIKCADGKVRRWIYLKENESDPVIDWLNPSFAGCRIAAADTLDSVYHLGQKMLRLDAEITSNAKETLSLWARKLGNYTIQDGKGGLDEIKQSSADMVADILTRPALLHALIAEDAEALKLMYRLFLEENIETRRLVHTLQPFDQFSCDWAEFLLHPKKRFKYYDEVLTGEALRMRLLKEDVARIGEKTPQTWPSYCMAALGVKDFEKKREDLTDTHLLLSFFYAMQPGAFSFSVSDLLGTLTPQTVDLMEPNEQTLYASLPGQFTNQKSFAMQLKKILTIRRESGIENGELLAIPETKTPGLILLIHRLPETGMLQLLAVNFSKTKAQSTIDMSSFKQTTAIDLMTGLAEKKPLDSSTLHLNIPALTGKVIRFQTKYY